MANTNLTISGGKQSARREENTIRIIRLKPPEK
jgi:hypothetical protein